MSGDQEKNDEIYQNYLDAIKEDPDRYSSYTDYLGANAMCMCEGCDAVIEYDERDEGGYCFDCQ